MDWLLQLWPLLYVLMCYSVSAGFDGVYIHSIGVYIDCCILRRRNWELYDQRFGWLCYKKCDCHKNSRCHNYLQIFILMRIEFKLSYCFPDPSSVSSKHGNFHVWRYVSTHENWSGFDLEFCIVAVHDYQIKKTINFTRVKEKILKEVEYNWYMQYRRCWNCVRNREYPIAGAWRDSKVPLIQVLVGSWFEGCQTYESAVAENDGVTISPVASDDEQVFILQHEAMCVFFLCLLFLNSDVLKEVKKKNIFSHGAVNWLKLCLPCQGVLRHPPLT